ncbi:MAG: hypothetical protein KBG48_11955 [Kofleriaceae bacterium]|jgi:hypothetical protein|nr:hypothetical protein [Kofleriaceae bacterium]MBP9168101.1 hypothetical protein [Kofleriaceae bacterium]MBP9856521.1 hypothetical protein [Kofleriaceae bacterium]
MPDPARRPQSEEDLLPKKEVTATAAARLAQARNAITATKAVMNFGAGNQVEALKKTNLNSMARLQVMREDSYWEIAPEVRAIAGANPEALIAAKADLAHGGNCGEHAWVAYHYLRQNAAGQHIQVSAKDGLDHAFVLIGDVQGEDKDNEIAVADPWPTRARACLWEDHFAFTPDRTKIEDYASMVADGESKKAAIAAGLRLSAEGQAYVNAKASQEETDEVVGKSKEYHLWNHPNTEANGHRFNYVDQDGH